MKDDLRTAFYVIVVFFGGLLIWMMVGFLQAHPQWVFVVLGVAGFLLLLGVIYVVFFLLNHITRHHHAISTRQAQLVADRNQEQREQVAADRAWQAEQRRLDLEAEDRRQRWLLEQQKLDLDSQRLQISAYQAQAVPIGKDQALVIRSYDGQGTRIAYQPQYKVTQVNGADDVELIDERDIKQLPRPRVDALEMLERGDLDVQPEDPKDDYIVLGVDEMGKIVRRTWRKILCILILGLAGGGKTNTVLWIVFQLLIKRYKIVLIDKHAKSDESTHARLKDFSMIYDTPVGDNPQAAMRAVNHITRVFTDRRDRGAPITYKVVFIVDEFTATMRATKDKTNEWHEVAVKLSNLIADLNAEGRKYCVYVICIGQASNASRTGGTEIRDLFHTRIVHAMRARQAQNLGLTDEKEAIQKLETGEVFLDVEGKDDPFFMVIPEVTVEFRQAVMARIAATRSSQKLVRNVSFSPVSEGFPNQETPETRRSESFSATPIKPVQHRTEDLPQKLPEIVQRVLDLKKAGHGKKAIIAEVWRVQPGGSERYKMAEAEYAQIIESLIALGYLQVQQQ